MSPDVKVILVSDSDNFVNCCLQQLQDYGYRTVWKHIASPADFTAALEVRRWDLAIADAAAEGFCMITLVKQRSSKPVPFIVVSPDGDDKRAVELLEAGASTVVEMAHIKRLGAITARELDIVFRSQEWYRAMDELQVAALAVESERREIEAKLRYLGTHDILTGLHNRAYFDEELERLKKSRKFPITILMADVDRLKEVNDNLGHAKGDELLKQAALVLRKAFRNEDVVARIGGDEFSALLPLTNAAAAREALRRIREGLAEYNDEAFLPLSLSMGMATAGEGDALAEVLKAADAQMYRDKLLNRSRLSVDFSTIAAEITPTSHSS